MISFVHSYFESISYNICGNNLLRGWPETFKNIDFQNKIYVVLIDLISTWNKRNTIVKEFDYSYYVKETSANPKFFLRGGGWEDRWLGNSYWKIACFFKIKNVYKHNEKQHVCMYSNCFSSSFHQFLPRIITFFVLFLKNWIGDCNPHIPTLIINTCISYL